MSNISAQQVLAQPHAVVLGAPGSGKTALLGEVVRAIEDQGVTSSQILVLTPSRLAANRLRDQIGVGSNLTSSRPRARSIASFAFELCRNQNPDLKLLSGAQQQAILAELLQDQVTESAHRIWGIDRATTELTGFHQEVRDLIAVVIENQLGDAQLGQLASAHDSKGLKVALSILPDYRKKIEALGAVDPAELLVLATEGLNSDNVPKFVLVDDAQDLTAAGLKLVSKLGQHSASYIFGDPDASVISFRTGGDSFLSSFSQHKRLALSTPYSNGPRSQLLPKIAGRIGAGLVTEHRPKPQGDYKSQAEIFSSTSDESDWLAATLRRARLMDKLPWDQMAVVARTRVQLDQLAAELTARNVPVRILGVQQPLRSQQTARAVLDFGALVFGLGETDREALLTSPIVGLDALGVRRLYRELSLQSDAPRSRTQVSRELFDTLVESDSFEIRALNRATELKLRLSNQREVGAYQFVSAVLSLLPLEKLRTLSKGRGNVGLAANRVLDSILELIAAAQRFDLRFAGSAKDFVSQQLELGIPEDSLAPIGLSRAVTLATSSQLAGLSFELLAIPRLQEGIWPNLRARNALLQAGSLQAYLAGRLSSPVESIRSELTDEIRLLYKAVGAAKSQLLLSAISTQDESPSQFLNMFNIELSQNDFGMDFDLRRQVGKLRRKAFEGDQSALGVLATLALAGVPGAHPKNWQGLLALSTDQPLFDLEEQKRLSASKLEAFEKCPLHWFIQTFSGDTGNFQASLGTLLHAALEANAQGVDVAEFVQSNWHTLEFESQWYSLAQQRRSARMVSMLNEYLSKSAPLVSAEQSFQFESGGLLVSGKIDRIERTDHGLVVVDLKTGKPPSKDEVAQNRQLALYQLAMQKQGEDVSHAQIVSVGGDGLKVIEQPGLTEELRSEIEKLLERVDEELAKPEYLAAVTSHCSGDSGCQLLIAKAVQNA